MATARLRPQMMRLTDAAADLSFPKIISEHIDDAVRPRLGWR
jgi:hypothetical protein